MKTIPPALADQIAAAVADLAPRYDADYRPAAPADMTAAQVAKTIDHTLLKPEATAADVRTLCDEARTWGFASVCVHPTRVAQCAELLADSNVAVCSVAGFPLGATLPSVKAFETEQVIAAGATEVDMVLNVGRLKDGDYATVFADVAGVVDAAHARGALVKVIFETCLLTAEEKIAASIICREAGADFIKTSTGFNKGGATLADVWLMRQAGGPVIGVKAAGGVRNGDDALLMLAAGATRIGASAGIAIVQSLSGAQPAPAEEATY
ncbi:MAG: deoxyribose-phosphate aldolase [Caldilineaceae bacterium]